MQSIAAETIYELTPAGHDVMQHRSLQLPTELRFLMMLINGSRTVGTLRVVSPGAKHDDAGFIILTEYGLIKPAGDQLQADGNPALLHEHQYPTAPAQENNVALFIQETIGSQTSMPASVVLENQMLENYTDKHSHNPVSNSPTYEAAFVTDANIAFETAISLRAAHHDHFANEAAFSDSYDELPALAMQHDGHNDDNDSENAAPIFDQSPHDTNNDAGHLRNIVSNEDRSAVEHILQRALKQDAKFVIDQLAQKNTYADFLPAIKKLENALRETVSATEANALRDRFSDVL